MAENFANNYKTFLDGSIDNSQTSIVVASDTGSPSVNFRIRIDDELMIVTAKAGATFTVTRGAEGTTAAAHNDDASVTGVLTAGALTAIQNDRITLTASGVYVGGSAYNGQTTTMTANSAYFRRQVIPFIFSPTLIGTFIKVSSGNLDLAVYADDGTGNAPGSRIASLGSTASPGTGSRVFSLSPGALGPGVVWLGVAVDNTTISIGYEGEGVLSTGLGGSGAPMGVSKATAFPLPNPAGAVVTTVTFAPTIWLEIA